MFSEKGIQHGSIKTGQKLKGAVIRKAINIVRYRDRRCEKRESMTGYARIMS
jgi:hypothetical protein